MVLCLTLNEAKGFFANTFEQRTGVTPCNEFVDHNWWTMLKNWGYDVTIIEEF